MHNPYNQNKFASGEIFVGREQILEHIINNIQALNNLSYVVFAGRRIGKTSLLYKIMELLVSKSSDIVKSIPVFISLEEKTPNSFNEFFKIIYNKTTLSIREIDPELNRFLDLTNSSEDYLEKIRSMLANISQFPEIPQRRIIWLIDEFERIYDKDWRDELYGPMRSLISGLKSNSNHISLVIAIVKRKYLETSKEGSSFLGQLEKEDLSNFSEESAIKLATNPIPEKNWTENGLKILLQCTGRNPFVLHYFLRILVNHFDDFQDITDDYLFNLVHLFIEKRGKDIENWENKYLEDNDRNVLGLILTCFRYPINATFDEEDIINEANSPENLYRIDSKHSVKESLNLLKTLGFLNKVKNSYSIAGDVVRIGFPYLVDEVKF